MKLGVSRRMLVGFGLELVVFAAAGVAAAGDPLTLVLICAGVIIATGLSISLSSGIARAAREMATAASGLARGDVDQGIEVRRPDDLGRIADALRDMIAYHRDMAGVADTMARGVLTSEIQPASERDVLGRSFVEMQGGLRRLVHALEHQALHDELTGLPNRVLLRDRLEHGLLTARRQGGPLSLLVLDLDRFKDVNDTLGHEVGDRLLVAVVERLRAVLRDCDTFARLGGDEFAVVLPGLGADEATDVARRILDALHEPFAIGGHVLEAAGSLGVAVHPEDGDAASLLRRADVAMYSAKRAQAGVRPYDPADDANSADRLDLVRELRHGIEGGELELHYQPTLDMTAGEVRGVEALVRWRHPTRGVLGPDLFVPLAERTGLIGALTAWVLGQAVRQCAEWRDAGRAIAVAVNLSARNLEDETLPARVADLLALHDVPPELMVLEITEGSLMSDPQRAIEIVRRLDALGIAVAVDDFGTGYSSLAHLKRLKVQELKIDRAFVQRMARDVGDAAIVRSTIALAHELGLVVVAEGVEDSETLLELERLGCDYAQGFYLSRPVPAAELSRWLSASAWDPHRGAGVA